MAINKLTRTDGGENNSSYLAKLQFILCQLDDAFTPKNRRRYNIVTQIMSIKTHFISPACYAYLQGLEQGFSNWGTRTPGGTSTLFLGVCRCLTKYYQFGNNKFRPIPASQQTSTYKVN